ncbi:MAG: glycosyltransferase family 39 protein [Anaerolineae bacterium]|nr:glycosyltransferase family 39 protein [Anaerolineae bacterium]MCO5203483.1 glycosyltransferase family 39 protein [Anaerolineae bacterium]
MSRVGQTRQGPIGYKTPWRDIGIVIALLLIAYGLRIFLLDGHDIWGDEAWSYTVSGWPLSQVIASDAETNPPLYHILLFAMRHAIGVTPFALRYLSVICGVFVTAILWRTARDVGGRWVGIWALAVAVVSPMLIFYSQEARMYGPALVGASGSLFFFTVLFAQTQRGEKPLVTHWLLYGLFSLIGVLSHYHAFAMLLAQAFFVTGWALAAGKGVWQRLRPWVLAWCGMALLFLPWLWIHSRFLGGKVSARFAEWTLNRLAEIGERTVAAFAVGTTVDSAESRYAWLIVLIAVLGALYLWRDRRWVALLLVVVLGVGLSFGWLINPFMPFFYERYLLVIIPAFVLLVGAGVAGFGRKRPVFSLIPFAVILIASGISLQNYFFDPQYAKGGYGDLMAQIESQKQPGDLILLNNPLQESLYSYYGPDDVAAAIIPRDQLINSADAGAYFAEATDGFRRVWLVEHGNSAEYDPERKAAAWLAANGSFAAFQSFPGSQLSLYVLDAPQTPATTLDMALGDGVRLTGFSLESDQVQAGQPLLLTLFWEGIRPIERDYTVFVHLTDENGQPVAQTDGQPGGGTRPTSGWQPGEAVRDSYAVPLAADMPPGVYTLQVGMYLWPELTRLTSADGSDAVVLGTVTIGGMDAQ